MASRPLAAVRTFDPPSRSATAVSTGAKPLSIQERLNALSSMSQPQITKTASPPKIRTTSPPKRATFGSVTTTSDTTKRTTTPPRQSSYSFSSGQTDKPTIVSSFNREQTSTNSSPLDRKSETGSLLSKPSALSTSLSTTAAAPLSGISASTSALAPSSGARPNRSGSQPLSRQSPRTAVADSSTRPRISSLEDKRDTSFMLQKTSDSRKSTPSASVARAGLETAPPRVTSSSFTFSSKFDDKPSLSSLSLSKAGAQPKKDEDEKPAPSVAHCMPLLEEYLRARYDPIIDTVKQLTDRVNRAKKLVKREKIRYSWDEKENQTANVTEEEEQKEQKVESTNIHVIICALDYAGTSNPLTCTQDGDHMQELCKACGVTDISLMYNRQANKDAVAAKIQRVASRCKKGDYFIFFYAGHGANVKDVDGDEDDGQDEAFCFVTPDGKMFGGWMTDDEFAKIVSAAVPDGVKVLVISDCCHSGTICDFDSRVDQWKGVQAVSLSGCRDSQTSGDVGTGGIFTHSLLLAVAELTAEGNKTLTIKKLFEKVLDKDDTIFDSEQDITMSSSRSTSQSTFMWPLIPKPGYEAPWKGRR